MRYGIKKATVYFDGDTGDIVKIETCASMQTYPHRDWDVRNIEAEGKNEFWENDFAKWKPVLHSIFQKTTAYGSET